MFVYVVRPCGVVVLSNLFLVLSVLLDLVPPSLLSDCIYLKLFCLLDRFTVVSKCHDTFQKYQWPTFSELNNIVCSSLEITL